MKIRRDMVALALAGVAIVGLFSACKRAAGPEKSMMATLAGAWTWKEAKVAEPTVVVLELTAKGRYKQSTYREVRNQRKLIYIKRLNNDVATEPETPDAIAKLKKDGYDPAVDEGAYRLKLGDKGEAISFESDRLTSVQKAQGSGTREEVLTIASAKIIIGGRTFQR